MKLILVEVLDDATMQMDYKLSHHFIYDYREMFTRSEKGLFASKAGNNLCKL